MAEPFDGRRVLDLLFNDEFELADSDSSEEEDGGESSYLGESPLDAAELVSLSEAIGEASVLEVASTSSGLSTTMGSPQLDAARILARIVS